MLFISFSTDDFYCLYISLKIEKNTLIFLQYGNVKNHFKTSMYLIMSNSKKFFQNKDMSNETYCRRFLDQ